MEIIKFGEILELQLSNKLVGSEKKHTVLQINVTANSGSTGRIVEEIGRLVLQKDWNNIIAYGRKEIQSSSKTIRIGNKISLYQHVLLTRIFDKHGLGSVKSTKKFLTQIEDLNPDIIHLHNIHGYYLNYKLLFDFLSNSGIPVVWTLHDCWPITGHCAYFDFVNCSKWETGCFNCPQKKVYPASWLCDRSEKNYRQKKESFTLPENITLVSVSNWLSNIINKSFLADKHHVLIRNGINLDHFTNRESGFRNKYQIQDKTIILGVASVWDQRKGLNDFIRLSNKLDKKSIIVLVGLSKFQMMKLPPNIIAIKRTENITGLAEIYSAADVFFNPTWEDNYPTTNLEAIACGTPVITYNTGGSIESVSDSTGYIIEKGNLNECLNALKDIREKGRSYFMTTCREYARNHFNQEVIFKQYIELYKKILGQGQ